MEAGEREPARRLDRLFGRIAPWVVLLWTIAVFAPAVRNEFVSWDDDQNFVDNPHWDGTSAEDIAWMLTSRHLGPYQPLSWLSLALDRAVWGDGPLGPHLGNVIYHALAAVVLLYAARRILALAAGLERTSAVCTSAAASAALFFAIHPLRVESVAWASERRDVLSGLWIGAAVLLYLVAQERAGRPRRWFLAGSLAAYALSLLSKAIGMSLPVVLLVLDAWPLGRIGWSEPGRASRVRACLVEKLPFAALAALAAAVALGGQSDTGALLGVDRLGPLVRFEIASYATWFYVIKTVWPGALWPHYTIPLDLDFSAARFPLALGASVLATAAALLCRRRWPWVLAAWVAWLALLAPVSGLTLSGRQIAADRYTYLPGMVAGLLGGGALLACRMRHASASARAIAGAAVVIALALLSLRSRSQIAIWRDSETLWRHVLQHEPTSVPAWNNLGQILAQRGEDLAALEHFARAVELAPAEPLLRFNLARQLDKVGRDEEAIAAARAATELDPASWNYELFLGGLLVRAGDLEGGIEAVERARDLEPGFVPIHVRLVQAYLRSGRAEDAEREVAAALAGRRGTPRQYLNLAEACADSGRRDLAVTALRGALEIHPGHPELSQALAERSP